MKRGSGITAAVVAVVLITSACRDVPPCTPQAETKSPAPPPAVGPAFFATASIPTNAPYNHASCIVQVPSGDLLTVWVSGSAEAAGDTAIVVSRRIAGSAQWTDPIIVADTPDAGDANPTLLVDPSGMVWLFFVSLIGEGNLCLGQVVVQTSTDDGRTWSTPREALGGLCTLIKNKPIILRGGRWVLPAYQQAIYQSQFWISDDSGQTWLPAAPLWTAPDANLQPAVVQLSDGSLFALMRGTGGFTWEGRSTDCARTFAMQDRRDLLNPNSGIDMTRLVDGRLALAFNPSATLRTPLSVSVSADKGVSWSSPQTLESGEGELSYPSIIQTADGIIHVTYSHQLGFIQHAEFNTAWLDAAAAMP